MNAKKDTQEGSDLEKKLSYKVDFAWNKFSKEQRDAAVSLAKNYMHFLNIAKVERRRTEFAVTLAEENGFKPLSIGSGKQHLNPGEKVYYVNRNKNVVLFIIGKDTTPMTDRIHFIGAHLDFPRLDLKINPVYEDAKTGVALFKTHYYGGVKKYQFGTIPLILTGVIVKLDGTVINVEIGNDINDPVFTIPDLLIHLNKNVQKKRKTEDVLKGEEMNALAGAIEVEDEKAKEKFKLNVLKLLNEKYGITEGDFHAAELSLVSALPARHVGLDKSMIGSAGQDDGICSFLGMKAILDVARIPDQTIGIGLFDKEEIGSNGSTGAQSAWIRQVYNDLMVKTGLERNLTNLHLCLSNTKMLSADVTTAMDPSFQSVHDPRNAAIFGKGVVIMKYTGHGGKFGASDATAEYMAYVRKIFEDAKVPYQLGTIGAVDAGGGGTIAKFFAESFNCDVVDVGPGLLNMHSPFEVSHVADLYSGYLAFKAFLNG